MLYLHSEVESGTNNDGYDEDKGPFCRLSGLSEDVGLVESGHKPELLLGLSSQRHMGTVFVEIWWLKSDPNLRAAKHCPPVLRFEMAKYWTSAVVGKQSLHFGAVVPKYRHP